MSFASDFVKSSTSYQLNLESSIDLIIKDRRRICQMYRVINAFKENHEKEKRKARAELRKILKIEAKIKTLSKLEVKELKAKKEQCEQIINSGEIIYFEGEPINENDTHYQMIKRFGYIIRALCKMEDRFKKKTSEFITTHIDNKIQEKSKNNKSKLFNTLSKIKFQKFINNGKVDIEKHKPIIDEF